MKVRNGSKFCAKCGTNIEILESDINDNNTKQDFKNKTSSAKLKEVSNSSKSLFSKIIIGVIFIIVAVAIVVLVVGSMNLSKDAPKVPKNEAISANYQGIENTVITFPDKSLEKIIRDTIKKPNGDILKGDVDTIRYLTYIGGSQDVSIKDLSGIENLTNLTWLDLCQHEITNIEPLSRLTNLTRLSLYRNPITNIEPLSGLTNLTWLNLGGIQIKSIEPLRGLTNLTSLNLGFNYKVTNIEPLSGLTNLTKLNLSTTISIKDIEPLKVLTNLTLLDLSQTKITNIEPLKGLNNLKNLSIYNSELKDTESIKNMLPKCKISTSNSIWDSAYVADN